MSEFIYLNETQLDNKLEEFKKDIVIDEGALTNYYTKDEVNGMVGDIESLLYNV